MLTACEKVFFRDAWIDKVFIVETIYPNSMNASLLLYIEQTVFFKSTVPVKIFEILHW